MEKQIIVRERQRVLHSDTMDMQTGLRATFDELVRQSVGGGNYYSGFSAAGNLFELTLQAGRLYMNGAMYQRTATTVFAEELFNLRPLSQKRVVAVVGWGIEVETTESGAATEPRQFMVNTTTRETEVQQVSTRSIRRATIDLIGGVEAAAPVAPSIGANTVLIALVTLGTTGVEAVDMSAGSVLPQSMRNQVAIADLAGLLEAQILRINTLISDQAAIKAGLAQMATKYELDGVRGVAELALKTAKLARMRVENLDTTEFVRQFTDDYRDATFSDPGHGDYDAVLTMGGLTFPAAAENTLTNGIELFNPVDPKVKVDNDLILPAFTHKLRIDSFLGGGQGSGNVAQAALQAYTNGTHTIQTMVPGSTTRKFTTLTASTSYRELTNPTPWLDTSRTLQVFGVSFDTHDTPTVTIPITAASEAYVRALISRNSSVVSLPDFRIVGITMAVSKVHYSGSGGSELFHFYQTWTARYSYTGETVTKQPDRYEQTTAATSVNGQGRAETWLQERDGWLTKVGVFVTQKAASEDLRIVVSMVDASGAPDLRQAPVSVTVPYAQIVAGSIGNVNPANGETVVAIPPMLCRGGHRYALSVISGGAHYLLIKKGAGHLTQGEHWALSDSNKWERPTSQFGSDKQTMALRLYFAEFGETSVAVDLKPLSLAGGIYDIDIQAQMVEPALTDLDFQVQPDGTHWRTTGSPSGQLQRADLSAGDVELMPFRVVFNGTRDIMPALSRGNAKSVVTVQRPAIAFTHLSQVIDLGSGVTANTVRVVSKLCNFDDDDHDYTVTVITDPAGTPATETADAVTDTVLPDGSVSRTSVFNLAGDKQVFQIKSVGAADDASALFYVDEIVAGFFDVA